MMKADGISPSVIALNSLINAFGEDRRDIEAFSVLQFMKDNVSCSCIIIVCTSAYLLYWISKFADALLLKLLFTCISMVEMLFLIPNKGTSSTCGKLVIHRSKACLPANWS